MVLKEDGSIWATGSNQDGQFGDGSTVSQQKFVKLAPFKNGARKFIFMSLMLMCFYLCAGSLFATTRATVDSTSTTPEIISTAKGLWNSGAN